MGNVIYLEDYLRRRFSPANDNTSQFFGKDIQFDIRYLAEIGRISRECNPREDGLEEICAIARAARGRSRCVWWLLEIVI